MTQVLEPTVSNPGEAFVPGLDSGAVAAAGLTSLAAGPTARDFNCANNTSFQFYENLYITKGTHTLKFGANFEPIRCNSSQPNLTGGMDL